MDENIKVGHSKWSDLLPPQTVALGCQLANRAQAERDGTTIYPPQDSVFRALNVTRPDQVKVCIVGQDPYHEDGQANGLAFSVAPGVKIPPSLRNIFKELESDIGCPAPESGDLTRWAEQGVLLLNTVLTVQQGKANSHASWGWQNFTSAVFHTCATLPQPVVFILWGGSARAFVADIPLSRLWEQKKACIWSSHPSPLGATQGNDQVPAFIGSKPFSKANLLLKQMGGTPVDWRL